MTVFQTVNPCAWRVSLKGYMFSAACFLLTEEVQMKTECNDLDERAAVKNFISWLFVLK